MHQHIFNSITVCNSYHSCTFYIGTGSCFKKFWLGAIQLLRNADGGGGCQIFLEKVLRRCKVQCYYRYEGVGEGPISRKMHYVTLEWPLAHQDLYL